MYQFDRQDPQKVCALLQNLLPELRRGVYVELLGVKNATISRDADGRLGHKMHPQILTTCKKIYTGAYPFLYYGRLARVHFKGCKELAPAGFFSEVDNSEHIEDEGLCPPWVVGMTIKASEEAMNNGNSQEAWDRARQSHPDGTLTTIMTMRVLGTYITWLAGRHATWIPASVPEYSAPPRSVAQKAINYQVAVRFPHVRGLHQSMREDNERLLYSMLRPLFHPNKSITVTDHARKQTRLQRSFSAAEEWFEHVLAVQT
ncbi:hypothetical protein LTR62_001885 [Meristemomyces frigidus]|uniref:Uncharacterized protein n=1 Tax=Meristemomyces frigidus TaxID=1508187 RepID=A0AAN7T835_9PEZI|nr:hypothetical protein LTR62_001885 [Meristemomyces frigidus]